MYGRFAGLDVGRKGTRISLIKRGLRETRLLRTIHSSSLDEVFNDKSLSRGDLAVSLASSPVSIRSIGFPFADHKKIDQTYEYELESVSTFDPREKIHAYHLVKREKGAEALTCVFEKSQLAKLLDSYNKAKIDPKVVTYGAIALGALDGVVEGARPLILIDIGDVEVCFTLFDNRGVRLVRSSEEPISSLYEGIGQKLGLSDNEVDFSKLNVNQESLKECLAHLIREIKRTIKFFEIELEDEVKTVLISGLASKIPGLRDLLKRELNRDVGYVLIPDLGVDQSPAFAKSYALALYGGVFKKGYLNFRKGEFSYVGAGWELRKAFATPAILLATLIFLLLFSSALRYFDLSSRVRTVDAQIAQIVKDTFPKVEVIPKPDEFMENEVAKVRSRFNLMQGAGSEPSPLDVLRAISESLPESLSLTVNEIRFEGTNRVKIRGICNSYQEVTEIEEALSKSGVFETVKRDQTGNAVDGKTKFEISTMLKSKV